MKIKICGMRERDNILDAVYLGPDFMGFIFYPESSRFVGKDFVMPDIPSAISRVGVFVNASVPDVIGKVQQYGLHLVQLHGNESPEYCRQLRETTGVIKAFGIGHQEDLSILKEYEENVDYFLLDTKTDGYGGSGKKFDWEILNGIQFRRPFFLSGGIGPEDVSSVWRLKSRPFAVDVNSRVEKSPGVKDIEKLKTLFHEVSGQ